MFLVFAPSIKLPPSGSPLCKVQAGHRLQARHKIRCLWDPRSRNDSNTVSVLVSLMHLLPSPLQVLYTRRPGNAYHRALQTSWWGWADSKAVHSMECRGGTLALLEDSLSVGAAACDALHCQRWEVYYQTSSSNYPTKNQNNRLTLGPVPGWYIYIAGDTLRHQPMGAGHMTVLQFHGPITFCVLQWCHPMLTRT